MRKWWFLAGLAIGFIGLVWLVGRTTEHPRVPDLVGRRPGPAPVRLSWTTAEGSVEGDFYPDAEYSGEAWNW